MVAPAARHHAIANELLLLEAGADASGAPVPAAERVLRRIFDHLAGWFGSDSIHALLSRALAHARRMHPALSGARIEFDGELRLRDVAAASDPDESAELTRALAALIATLFSLLGRLVGEDMVARLLHQIWPGDVPLEHRTDVPPDDTRAHEGAQ